MVKHFHFPLTPNEIIFTLQGNTGAISSFALQARNLSIRGKVTVGLPPPVFVY
jgi:hypothetical protein